MPKISASTILRAKFLKEKSAEVNYYLPIVGAFNVEKNLYWAVSSIEETAYSFSRFVYNVFNIFGDKSINVIVDIKRLLSKCEVRFEDKQASEFDYILIVCFERDKIEDIVILPYEIDNGQMEWIDYNILNLDLECVRKTLIDLYLKEKCRSDKEIENMPFRLKNLRQQTPQLTKLFILGNSGYNIISD